MKIVVAIVLFLSLVCDSYSQSSAVELIGKFKPMGLPVENISSTVSCGSLDNVWLNNYLFPREGGKVVVPNVMNSEGELKRHGFTGRYPEGDQIVGYYSKEKDGSFVERKSNFHNRIDAIGRIHLSVKYILLILRIESIESVFYDLWSVDKTTLEPLSQICLFYGYKKAWNDSTMEYIEVESEITDEGLIVWHSDQRGLQTYTTWKLDEETGLFRIVSELQEGEFDY